MRKILLEKIKNNNEIEYYAILENEITPKIIFKYYPLGENLAVACFRDKSDCFLTAMFDNNRVNEYIFSKNINKQFKTDILKIVKNYVDLKNFEYEIDCLFFNSKIEVVEKKRKKANYTVDEFEIDFKKLNNQHY